MTRILLESVKHKNSCFATFTYDQDSLPIDGSVSRKDQQNLLKRLRKQSKDPIRYAGVAEYGTETFRPHYHAIIFGVGPCYYFQGTSRQDKYQRLTCRCPNCETIRKSWQANLRDGRKIRGATDCGTVTFESAQYIAGYITKKLTQPDSDKNYGYRKEKNLLLGDRKPEFSFYSLKPGIGAAAMDDVAEVLTTEVGCDELIKTGDVPLSLRSNGKPLVLDRYLRRKLRERLGFMETGAQPGWQIQQQKEMRILLQAQADKLLSPQELRSEEIKLLEMRKQKILNIESRHKVFSKKGEI